MCIRLPNWPQERLCRKRPGPEAERAPADPALDQSPKFGLGAMASARLNLRRGGHALPDMPTEAGGHGTRKSGFDKALVADPSADLSALRKLARWCRRYSPLVGVGESDVPDSLLLDVGGSAHLFGGEESLARQVVDDLSRFGLTAHVAIADTVGAAWALAHDGQPAPTRQPKAARQPKAVREPAIAPAGQHGDRLRTLPVEALRLAGDVVATLDELGIRTIGQLVALPRETLPSRFGPTVLRRLDQALGELPELIEPERPEEPLEARWGSEHPIEDRFAIETILSRLLDELRGRIERRNEGILEFLVELQSPGRDAVRFAVGLVRPTLESRRLSELVRLQLERAAVRGVVGLIVRITRRAPLAADQSTIFDTVRRDGHGTLAWLLDRLSNRLGRDAVLSPKLRPDFQPERAVEYRHVVGPGLRARDGKREPAGSRSVPCRPLRLLPEPAPVVVWSIVPDGPPVRLRWRNADCRIVRCEGPERLETGWWREGPVSRDYFRIDTEDGQRLWLFRSADDAWFVHGEF